MEHIPVQVQHLKNHLREKFEPYIDMEDSEKKSHSDRESIFLSRALTALALEDLLDCTPIEAANNVIDGRDDYGIDGVGVDLSDSVLYIVQAKWKHNGRAGFDKPSALALCEGIQKLKNQDFEPFNERFQNVAPLVRDALSNPDLRVVLVLALAGDGLLSDVVRAAMDENLNEFNELGEIATLETYTFARFHNLVRKNLRELPVSLVAPLQGWSVVSSPYSAVYGRIAAADVAQWYGEHGEKLFSQNIRRSLGNTEVNRDLRRTLSDRPENFWYFNNGITMLCEAFKRAPAGNRDAANFHVQGASVVNGAQTVSAIASVVSSSDEVPEASVWIRLISLEDCPEDFANSVTEATNRQNTVVARDFVSLDPAQTEIREQMALSLGKVYVVKRGEPDPDPSRGCSVSEAAKALAAISTDARLAARANNSDDSVLFERDGTYERLFYPQPSPEHLWRAVVLLRTVSSKVSLERERRYGRAAAIADLSSLLVLHISAARLRRLGRDPVISPDEDTATSEIEGLVSEVLDRVVSGVDQIYGPSSFPGTTMRSAERCTELSSAVLAGMAEGLPSPELPADYWYRRQPVRNRRANAVSVLVDAQSIADGERLHFIASGEKGQAIVETWIDADPRRGRATWVNKRAGCLIWELDGRNYSPSGLAKRVLNSAGIPTIAVQGPIRWRVGDRGTIASIAESLRAD